MMYNNIDIFTTFSRNYNSNAYVIIGKISTAVNAVSSFLGFLVSR